MKTPDFRLDGRVAVITGASRGLGKAMAFAMGAAGAKVAINYAHSQETAERTFDEFRAAGYKGMLVRANVTDESEVDGMITSRGDAWQRGHCGDQRNARSAAQADRAI